MSGRQQGPGDVAGPGWTSAADGTAPDGVADDGTAAATIAPDGTATARARPHPPSTARLGPTSHRTDPGPVGDPRTRAALARLTTGIATFHADPTGARPALARLAGGQHPYGLILTCADSRVLPPLLTGSGPGELFTVQNVGNMVAGTAVDAALDYATDVLDVPLLVVVGHSTCGAMGALLGRSTPTAALGAWLAQGQDSVTALHTGHPVGRAARAAGATAADALAMVNVAVQLDRLARRHPDRARCGLFLDLPTATVRVLDEATHRFR